VCIRDLKLVSIKTLIFVYGTDLCLCLQYFLYITFEKLKTDEGNITSNI